MKGRKERREREKEGKEKRKEGKKDISPIEMAISSTIIYDVKPHS